MRKLRQPDPVPTSETSPLASPRVTPSTQHGFKVGWATDVGRVRSHNEDTALVLTAAHSGDEGSSAFGLFIVADGMGGHLDGEIASSLAARVAAHHIVDQCYLPHLLSGQHGGAHANPSEILAEAVQAANSAVMDQVPGGGTTLTCALLLGSQAFVAHVGDSRAYVVSERELEQITHDHSVVNHLIESGQLPPDQAAIHPQKNVLYRAVGQSDELEVNIHVREIAPGDRLLLCSDGLWDMVSDDRVTGIVANAATLQTACDDLITTANQAGGRDNVTAILLEPASAGGQ